MDIEKIADKFEQTLPIKKTEENPVVELASDNESEISAFDVVRGAQQKVLKRTKEKIGDNKTLERHAKKLAEIADKAMEVDAERAELNVQRQDADNKVEKQEIKNRLIVLKAEAKRLKKEQKQLDREQKADHRAKNKAAKWELYKGKLQKMGYDYVPNVIILSMLLFFDGVKSFFDGVGKVSTSFVVAMKWVLLLGAIMIVLFSIPATRIWLINLLN